MSTRTGIVTFTMLATILAATACGQIASLTEAPLFVTATPRQIVITNTPLATQTRRPTPTRTATPGPALGESFDRPIPVGIGHWTLYYTPFDSTSKIEFELTVLDDTLKAEDAWNMLHQANMFNDPPPAGTEYALVHLRVVVTSAENNGLFDGSDMRYAFNVRSRSLGRAFDVPLLVVDEDFDYLQLYEGGDGTGWLPLIYQAEDQAPLMVLVFGDGTHHYYSLTP